jgi:hypothetical protein
VTIDALVLSRAVGRPVRVQWWRADENGWEAYKAARISECQGGLDANGKIVAWDARTFGLSGYSRPEYHKPKHGGEPGSLVTAQLAGWTKPGLEEGFSGAAGNFEPVYEDMPNKRVSSPISDPRRIDRALRFASAPCAAWDRRQHLRRRMFHGRARRRGGMDAIEFRLKHARVRAASRAKAAAEKPNGKRGRPIPTVETATSPMAAASPCSAATRTPMSRAFMSGAVNRRTGVSGRTRHHRASCGLMVIRMR